MNIHGNYIAIGSDVQEKNSIISLNASAKDKLLQAKRPVNPSSFAYLTKTQPVVLLHFSDVHGDQLETERIAEFYNAYSDYIDDAIFTGDMARTRWGDGIAFWTAAGADNILIAIGNHDVLTDPSGWDWNQRATQSEQYSRYVAPFVSGWDVQSTQGLTYYYKDYQAKKLRLIVLNCMLTGDDDSAQLSWLETTLTGAKNNDYTVAIAEHLPLASSSVVPCNFSTFDKNPSSESMHLPTTYLSAVSTFVSGGGKFACWLAGHTHYDVITKNTEYNQICICIDALSRGQGNQYSDTQRTNDTISQDIANLVVFDTESAIVKVIRIGANMDRYLRKKDCITIKYTTGEIISQN